MKSFRERPHVLWFGLAALLLAAEALTFFEIWTSFAENERWSIHTHQVLEQLEASLSQVKDAETGQRGYLLTGQDAYLEPYDAALRSIPASLDRLSGLTADNPRQQSRVQALRSLVGGKLAELNRIIDLRRTRGAADALAAVATGRGKQIMDRIRTVMEAMKAEEMALLEQRNQSRRLMARAMVLVMSIGAALLLLVLLVGMRTVGRSTADRARAEAAEKRQREWLEVTLVSVGDGVIATDAQGRITLLNPVAAQLTGWPVEEAQGQPVEKVFDIRNEDTGKAVDNPALRAIRDRRVVGLTNHTILVSRDGKRIPLDDSGAPILDASGNIIGAVLIFRDSSEKKAREAELRRRDRLLSFSRDAVIVTDAQRRIQSWNRGASELYGWEEAEARDKVIHDLLRTSQSPAEMDQVLSREDQWRGELDQISKDGKPITVESRQILLRDPEAGTGGILEINRDITERKRAEAALRESERQFRTLANAIPQLCWTANADGWLSWYNERWYAYTGTTPQQMEGWGWQSVHDPAALPQVLERWQASIATGQPFDMVFPLRGADGVFRPFLTRVMPVHGRDGEVVRWFGTNTDIGERTKMEQDLRLSEERYRTLFDTLLEGFCIIEVVFDGDKKPIDYRFLEINRVFEERTGLKNAQGRLMRELAPDHEAHWFETYGRVALTGQPVRFVNEAKALNRWYDVSAYRIGGPESRRVAILFNDITQRKLAQDALAASEGRLGALLESASQGVVAIDEKGHMALVNAKTEEMFGYTRDELLGRPLDVLLPERFRPVHAGHLQHYFARPSTRAMGIGLDLCGRSKDGAEFPLEVSLSWIEQGGSRLAMALITDTTERKKSEERLRQAQKLESIGLLAGGVAHDFNNLLVGVIGNASLAREILPPGHEATELLQGVIGTGERLAHLTRQMLAYSGKGRFLVEPLDLSDLVPEMSALVQPSIPKKIAVHFELVPDLPPVEADRGQMQQVFMNLVINAAEAIGSHAGLISVKTGLQTVDGAFIRIHPEAADLHPGRYVALEVRDTGSGMDKATQAKIFDPFFSTKFQGRGLGLAAVSGIVRGHKGVIIVASTPGKGTCFTVLFPAAEGATPSQPVSARDASLQGVGTVLVVDDEEVVRMLAKKALERYGYHVLLAEGGLAAIDVFKRHPGDIALVLLDLSMPDMGGVEALPELRKIRPNVKVVVSSGYSEAETMRLFAGQPVSGFFPKPFTAAHVASVVKKALG